MADGWDLHAVVRSCTSAAATTTNEDPFPNLSSPTFQNDDNPFCYSGQNTNYEGLEEIYKELYSQPQVIPLHGGFVDQQHFQNPQPFPATNSQTIRPRRRKNQQSKMVRQMTEEELSADLWAWRKYGQKPIKGSPYPRNYYRCSTSKGCAAKKQVERSPTDSTLFVVSYSGEHTHPRPTHRSSLAGSTRGKFSAAKNPTSGDSAAENFDTSKPSCSSSSPPSASSFTPSSPHDDTQKVAMEIGEDDVETVVGDDEEDILIPNTVVAEDIFKGFKELNGGREGWSTTDGSDF